MVTEALQVPLGFLKAGYGVYQAIQGNKMLKTPRPDFEIPEGATQALNQSEYLAGLNQLPGQDKIEQNIDSQTADAFGRMRQTVDNPSAILGNIGKLSVQNQNQKRQLGIQAAQFKMQNMMNYQNQLNAYAKWQQMANQWNVYQPYQQKIAMGMNLLNAGTTNAFGGLNDIAAGIGAVGDWALSGGTSDLMKFAGGNSPAQGNAGGGSPAIMSGATNPNMGEWNSGYSYPGWNYSENPYDH